MYYYFPLYYWPRFSARPDLERSLKNKKRKITGFESLIILGKQPNNANSRDMTELNAEILRRIVDNDASVAGVRVSQQSLTPRLREFGCSRIEELGEMIGTAIGNSRQLLRLEI
jgi:hypothetical protein